MELHIPDDLSFDVQYHMMDETCILCESASASRSVQLASPNPPGLDDANWRGSAQSEVSLIPFGQGKSGVYELYTLRLLDILNHPHHIHSLTFVDNRNWQGRRVL
jgi:hypothetical protein